MKDMNYRKAILSPYMNPLWKGTDTPLRNMCVGQGGKFINLWICKEGSFVTIRNNQIWNATVTLLKESTAMFK